MGKDDQPTFDYFKSKDGKRKPGKRTYVSTDNLSSAVRKVLN